MTNREIIDAIIEIGIEVSQGYNLDKARVEIAKLILVYEQQIKAKG